MTQRALVLLCLVLLTSFASLPPHVPPFADDQQRRGCNYIRMLVGLFGEQAVIKQAKQSGVSEATLSSAWRRCFGSSPPLQTP